MKRYFPLLALTGILLLVAMILGVPAASAAAPGDIVINEIMQNPSAVGDDAGEWFELYNPTGSDIDIDGWTIKDDDIDTHLIANGGPLLIPAGGYLVLGNNADTATNGGAPVDYAYGSGWFLSNSGDEVVLLDGGLTEIDRVEYDGGPTFPDPTGASMSLSDPALDNNVGANWCEASTLYGDGDLGTPGTANDCPVSLPKVVINEIMQNPSAVSDSAGEWFELFNASADAVDIDGWTIKDDDSDSHVIANGGPLLIPAGGYLVLGNNADTATNGGAPVDYAYGSGWFLSNSGDEVVLLDGGLTEIDRVEYDGGPTFPDPTGASMSLSDPALDNNVGANWCEASTAYGDGDLGTPGTANDCPIVLPEIVINEIMQNPAAVSDSAGEWFELFNASADAVDIDGWTIKDDDSDSHVIANDGPLLIPAGGYLVLGNNADTATNGGVTVDYAYGSGWYLSNGADEVVLLDGGLAEIDRVEYDGGPTFPDPTGASMSLSDPTLDNNVGENWCTSVTPFGDGDLGTPGAENICPVGPDFGACTDPSTFIHEVQGSGATSPLENTIVVIEGVVVGDFQNNSELDNGDLNGFYVQEEDIDADADPATSEGVFVYAPAAQDVSIGDQLRIKGSVVEFSTSGGSLLTELTDVSDLAVCGTASIPAVTDVTLPVSDIFDFERNEGMYVTFSQDLVIAEYFNFDRFNETVLAMPAAGQDRPFQPTAVFEPGSPEAAALADLNARSRITLDDGRTSQNSDPAIHPNGEVFDLDNLFRGGDIVQAATGVIDETFGIYRIQPVAGANYTPTNLREDAHDPVGGNLEIASFNVLNYFTTLDGNGKICGPVGYEDYCRGADNAEEFERQRVKILSALSDIDADVFGLIELENTTGVVPLQDIVNGLNDLLGPGTYDYVDSGTIGTDVIKVGLIYKPASVMPLGSFEILDSDVDPRFDDEKNRPVLAQTFLETANGGVVTVAVNHLKSKGSSCGPGDDDPEQGSCNLTRTLAAQAMVDWLATDPTNSGDPDFLITGDLNSNDKEDPIDAIIAGSDDAEGTGDDYTDLIALFQGELAYTYVFSGQFSYLDHALSNATLTPQVTGATVWHINSDESDILDYNTDYKKPPQQALFEPNAFRSSDHDPVIVGLDVCDEIAPTLDVTVSPPKLWPPNHKYVSVTATVIAADNFDPNPTITLLSVTSNEPDNGLGDGDTPDDIVIIDDFTFDLRAERSGTGVGRIYTITYEVTDTCGNSTTASAEVVVPKDKGKRAAVSFLDAAAPSMLTSPVLDD